MTTEAQFFSLRELAGPLRQVKESQKWLRVSWEGLGSKALRHVDMPILHPDIGIHVEISTYSILLDMKPTSTCQW